MTAVLRTAAASLALLAGFLASLAAASAQETTIKIGLVRSISNGANLWGIEQGLLQGSRHQPQGRGARHLGQRAGDAGAEPAADHRRRCLGRLFQRAAEKSADHHRDGPGVEPARPQPDAAARSQGPDHRLNQFKGKVIATNGHGAVSTYEVGKHAGDRRHHHRRRRDQGAAVPADGGRVPQQGDRRRHRDPAVHRAADRRRLRRAVQGSRRSRQAASDVDRGQHDQHRMGEGERPRGAQLLRRLSARACATTARPITAARTAPR